MKILSLLPLLALLTMAASAAEITEPELLSAAKELATNYDTAYAARDPEGMARLYAEDGILVSPTGSVVRGRSALHAYYTQRFAAGARDHHISIIEAHLQGDGGYSIANFSVVTVDPKGEPWQVQGHLVTVYRKDPDGWHLRLVEPSVEEK